MTIIPNEFCIQTGTHYFDYENPSRSTTTLEDIAYCLGNVCRWGGWSRPFYSVAQHAQMVADIALDISGDPLTGYVALHHDDHEAFRGDIPSPRKRFLKAHGQLYKGEQETQDQWLYEELIGISWPQPEEVMDVVKKADWIALITEKEWLQPPSKWPDKISQDDNWGTTFAEPYLSRNSETYLELHFKLKGLL